MPDVDLQLGLPEVVLEELVHVLVLLEDLVGVLVLALHLRDVDQEELLWVRVDDRDPD